MAAPRWDGSLTSKSKRIRETRSAPVSVWQATMLMWWSDSTAATSRSSLVRSSARTSTDTR